MIDWVKQLIDRCVARRRAEAQARAHQRELRRAAAERRRERERQNTLRRARAVMSGPFVVADLETTGFSSDDEILEIAAIRVTPGGEVTDAFCMLVRPRRQVPRRVVELTGITEELVRAHGVGLRRAYEDFVDFCDGAPVFCHNAGFDTRFLRAAGHQLGMPFELPVHCSLKVARAAWPQLRTHRLEALAQLVGAPAPTHRGIDDVYATLAVLTAIKDVRPVAEAA